MPVYYEVTVNGVPLFKGLSKEEAFKRAERWQGKKWKSGLLKHKDYGDHVEVRIDKSSGKDFDDRYADVKAGKPQRVLIEEYIP